MRTLNATLQAAMDSGVFTPIVRAAILDPDDFSVIQYLDLIYFKINGLEIDIEFYDATEAFSDTVSLERGALINGTEYTIFSGIYHLTNSYKVTRGHFKCSGHLVAPASVNIAADVSYDTIITAVMSGDAIVPTYKTPAAAWLGYQFFPDSILYKAGSIYSFFSLLRQKYLIHATDNGIGSVLFFSVADSLAIASQYTLTLTAADTWSIQTLYRQFTWKDENGSLHTPGPAGYVVHNLGYLETTASAPNVPNNVLEVGETCITCIPNLKYQTGDCVKFDPVLTGYTPVKSVLDVTEIFDARGSNKNKPAWYMELRPLTYFTTTAGGYVPATVQYANAFIDLATTGFNHNLDASVTNIQQLADYIDDLDISRDSENLSGLTDAAAARTNLGLGTMAVLDDAPSDGSTYGRKNGSWQVAGVAAPVFLDGSSDAIQLRVQANSTQTANIQTWEASDGTVLAKLCGDGTFAIGVPGSTYSVPLTVYKLINSDYGTDFPSGSFAVQVDTAYSGMAIGLSGYVTDIHSSGTVAEAAGLSFYVRRTGDGNLNNAYGTKVYITNQSAVGRIANTYLFYGFYSSLNTIYNAYGLYLENVQDYAIYTNNGKNRLGDQLSIVPRQNVTQLIVAGYSTQTSQVAHIYSNDTTNNAVREALRLETRNSTASTGGAAGFGPGLTWYAESSADGTFRQLGQVDFTWATATDASRKGRGVFSVYDSATREVMRIEASGSAGMLSFFGANAVVKQTGCSAQEAGYVAGTLDTEAEIINAFNDTNTAINTLRTALINYGLITDV